ncbi:hypothetical protein [Paracidovorax anthurii]|uniref:Uncharacterized protein n=1 Tax=Paracidovorax anthurii TaxID=78229 RepID=A0A328YYT0_9BURK|nr:hypothetical protein [Paracidovorax anthurii]RAR77985.1 hypothetical protein AX018_103323 [Paracidovorax anthurii]WCM94181.1 hypothetical protein M5C99_05485 [Acidovorax sp. NCPPB 2350]
MSNDPFTQIINQVLQGLVSQLNREIKPAITGAGYDPYQNVASGSTSIGIGSASYSVTDLTGISSLQIQDMVVSNLNASGTNLSGTLNFHAQLTSSLSAQASGSVRVLFVHPGISGNIRIDNPTIAGSAQFQASTSGGKLCLNSISGMSANFNYGNASIWINDLGPLNYLLQPVENLILDAAKGAIRSLISSQVNDIVSQQLNKLLPQCVSFP